MTAPGNKIISPPQRATLGGAAAICAVIALLSFIMVMPHRIGFWTVATVAILALCAVVSRSGQAVHLSLFALLWIALPFTVSVFRPWPFGLLIPIAAYGILVAAVPPLRRSFGWLRRGRWGADVLRLVLATVVVSGVALVVWYGAVLPDVRQSLKYLPHMPIWIFPLAGLGFAMRNAALEEAIFRGIIMDALDSAFGPGNTAIALQAASFALLHYVSGFPSGGWGLAMTFVYGRMLGTIRRCSQGMLAPLLEAGAVSEESFEDILAELDGWQASDGDFYALSRQVQVSGERP